MAGGGWCCLCLGVFMFLSETAGDKFGNWIDKTFCKVWETRCGLRIKYWILWICSVLLCCCWDKRFKKADILKDKLSKALRTKWGHKAYIRIQKKEKRERTLKSKSGVDMSDFHKGGGIWFRPEKFKILLTFVQIFTNFKRNYGIKWPTIVTDYMRLFGLFQFNLLELTATECIYRIDFYFSLEFICAGPIIVLFGVYFLLAWGKFLYRHKLMSHPRFCVYSGRAVYQWLSASNSKKLFKEMAYRQIEDDFPGVKGKEREIMARKCATEIAEDADDGIPLGSSRLRKYSKLGKDKEKSTMLKPHQLKKIIHRNKMRLAERVIIRLNYMNYVNKCWKLFFWVLLLIYPTISMRIMRLFHCEQIGVRNLLVRDLSLECFTRKWQVHALGAIGATVLYVIGIPALFMKLLVNARNKGVNRIWDQCHGHKEGGEKRREQLLAEAKADADISGLFWQTPIGLKEEEKAVKSYLRRRNLRFHRTHERLGFIYYAYNEDKWWYEIVELFRKLSLNGLIVLISNGEVSKITVGLTLCFLFIIVLQQTMPYNTATDHWLALACSIQLFITLLCGFTINLKIPFLGEGSKFGLLPHELRDMEHKLIQYLVIGSHAGTCFLGFVFIIREKFFSDELEKLERRAKQREDLHKNVVAQIHGKKPKANRKLGGFGQGSVMALVQESKALTLKPTTLVKLKRAKSKLRMLTAFGKSGGAGVFGMAAKPKPPSGNAGDFSFKSSSRTSKSALKGGKLPPISSQVGSIAPKTDFSFPGAKSGQSTGGKAKSPAGLDFSFPSN